MINCTCTATVAHTCDYPQYLHRHTYNMIKIRIDWSCGYMYLKINVWITLSVESVTGWPDTHTYSSYLCVRSEKLNIYRLSASSSAARIPPSRRGNISADISVIGDIELHDHSGERRQYPQMATARTWWRSVDSQEQMEQRMSAWHTATRDSYFSVRSKPWCLLSSAYTAWLYRPLYIGVHVAACSQVHGL